VNARELYDRTPRPPANEFEKRLLADACRFHFADYHWRPPAALLQHAAAHPQLLLYRSTFTWLQHLAERVAVAFFRFAWVACALAWLCSLFPMSHAAMRSALQGIVFISALRAVFLMWLNQQERDHWGVDLRIWLHVPRRRLVTQVETVGGTRRCLQRALAFDELVLKAWSEERDSDTGSYDEVLLGLFKREGPAEGTTEVLRLQGITGLEHRDEIEHIGRDLGRLWQIPFEHHF